jgi:hypothetical protein
MIECITLLGEMEVDGNAGTRVRIGEKYPPP